ncbi:MAG: (E)-4-hydroxy-3-methylbut-2-enyl-diphosphate synthase [Luteolibacter sp.]
MTSSALLHYCPDLLHYSRRASREVRVGNVGVGGANPIRVQSMITSDTRDTPACVAEVLGLAEAGCEIVRITAQTKVYAANLENIAREVRAAGCEVPLVADIHFKPDAALEAAKWVEKVRVNPGNYADKKKFEIREYSDAQYGEELERIREEFTPLVMLCKDLGRAMRIGTNHGSLSDRIMNRYGDTPLGMCESALEFARLARENDYHDFIFSMKASNPKVMIEAYRLLVARLAAEGPDWNYPIHLGVTEAGDGEDGRIKSAIGIGSLLADGIGDTIRVSLTEDAIYEIPVAQALAAPFNERSNVEGEGGCGVPPQAVFEASRRKSFSEDAQSTRIDWDTVEKSSATFLPHWKQDGATYAVTFRLADSLPAEFITRYQNHREQLQQELESLTRSGDSRSALDKITALRKQITELQSDWIDPELDRGHGACLFKDASLAQLVADAMAHFDGKRYELLAWCVMPNHVHAVLTPAEGELLEKILHSWKSFTAHEINHRLGTNGAVWQKESYDHLVRDGEDLKNQVGYVMRNPVKAGLGDWVWVGCVYEELAAGRSKHGLRRDAAATLAPAALGEDFTPSYDPFSYERRVSSVLTIMGHELGGDKTVRVFTTQERWNSLAHKIAGMGDFKPEIIFEKSGVVEIDPRDEAAISAINSAPESQLVTVADGLDLEVIHAFRQLALRVDSRHPILLKDTLRPPVGETDFIAALLPAARNIGSLLCDGIGDAILIRGETAPGQSLRLAYNILQAAGTRIFKTDYVACPSCGRTLFNLQHTTQKIRAATGHLKGVRIAVMGCIVNGPGEMADADFGYVGGAPGKINLYVGKTAVKFNIPEAEAVERLTDLIREHGKWVDAPEPATV